MKNIIETTVSYLEKVNLSEKKVERTLFINNKEIASENLRFKINTKMSQISKMMMELEIGREFNSITTSDFQIILDVFESSTTEYFKEWLQSKIK